MKKLIILSLLFIKISFCQSYDPFIQNLVDQTNLDSLISFVRILSGEDSVIINDTNTIITHRVNSWGNDLAADYLKNKMTEFGFETIDQNYSEEGRNIYSIQTGTLYPEEYYILCAHYDAVTNYCADDNASGVAGVLEAARILSNFQFNFSIIYAFWDEEEIGANGSEYFAEQADSAGMNIGGVLNFEMSGWDSDNDGLIDIHTRRINESIQLANTMVVIDSLYNLPLKPVVYNPGTTASDHSSFWNFDYSAIVFSEAFYGGDFNPYYHSSFDRIQYFNLPYFFNIVKLSTASIATLATEGLVTSVEELNAIPLSLSISNYPNPFNNSTRVKYNLPNSSNIRIDLYNFLGERVKEILSSFHQAGSYEIEITSDDLSSGAYFLVINTDAHYKTHKIILLK